jgi:serine/threonine protein kinase
MIDDDREVLKVVGTPFGPLTRTWCRHEAECLSKLADLGFAHAPGLISLNGNSFTMEMIDGPSLRGHQPVDEELFLRVLDVVHHLHDLGFAHGNLRPNNILITDEKEPFLIDFETCCQKHNPLFFLAQFSDHVRLYSLWQSRVVKSALGRERTTFPRSVTLAMFFLTPLNRIAGVFKSIKKRLRAPRKVLSEHSTPLSGSVSRSAVAGKTLVTPPEAGFKPSHP